MDSTCDFKEFVVLEAKMGDGVTDILAGALVYRIGMSQDPCPPHGSQMSFRGRLRRFSDV